MQMSSSSPALFVVVQDEDTKQQERVRQICDCVFVYPLVIKHG